MARRLKPHDEGKALVTPRGDIVGVLDRIHAGTAYVRPTPGLLSGYGPWISGSIQDDKMFRLDEESVAEIASDRVVIERDSTEPSHVLRIK